MVSPVFSRDPLRERVGDRLGDERLAAAGRAVEQDALRRLQLVLVEHLGVQVRELDRVLDRVDLVVEPADVVVGDVGDLFEHELLDLGAWDALDEQAGAAVHQQVVAGAQLLAEQRRRRARTPAPRRPGRRSARGACPRGAP